MRNGFTRFLRVWLAALLLVSFAASTLMAISDADERFSTAATIVGNALLMGCVFTFPFAFPMLVITFIGWVVCGGIQK
jgi:hypothetical protein